ncbi:MAG TPA: hypothetical protein VL325_09700 [Pyrinomonadaceae bacterium]|jgi:hypothetical protein|nr:hypothetical protein [Pyrinomonadaceae bacterium]
MDNKSKKNTRMPGCRGSVVTTDPEPVGDGSDRLDRKSCSTQPEETANQPMPGESGNERTFRIMDETEFVPKDFEVPVFGNSIEGAIGYSSLVRQLNDAFVSRVQYYRSSAGGSLNVEEARKQAFRPAHNQEEERKIFDDLVAYPVDKFDFTQLAELHHYAPQVAEWLWEKVKEEGRKEFESGISRRARCFRSVT